LRNVLDLDTSPTRKLHAALDGKLSGYLRTDPAARALWSTDASIYLRRPVAVAVVRSEEDIRRTLAAAREIGLSVTPRGTGTSLAGQATAPGIALDTTLMQEISEVDLENGTCSVEPGVIQGELNERVEPHGLVFGADTSTSDVATLGGMIGNNSAGMRSLVFGMTADQILSLRCVLATGETVELKPLSRSEAERRARGNGAEARLLKNALQVGERYADEIKRRYPKLIRRVSGYGLDALIDPDTLDLNRLVCGSEGTLAVITRAELRLQHLPPQRALASFQLGPWCSASSSTWTSPSRRASSAATVDFPAAVVPFTTMRRGMAPLPAVATARWTEAACYAAAPAASRGDRRANRGERRERG
jgi:FAD/FMN-containing dehydrogenase